MITWEAETPDAIVLRQLVKKLLLTQKGIGITKEHSTAANLIKTQQSGKQKRSTPLKFYFSINSVAMAGTLRACTALYWFQINFYTSPNKTLSFPWPKITQHTPSNNNTNAAHCILRLGAARKNNVQHARGAVFWTSYLWRAACTAAPLCAFISKMRKIVRKTKARF